jgi:hypothetical protein
MEPKFQLNLDTAGKVIGLAAAISFALSACFNYGYIYGLGISFGEVPLSVSDFPRDALNWLPQTLMLLLAAYVYVRLRQVNIRIDEKMLAVLTPVVSLLAAVLLFFVNLNYPNSAHDNINIYTVSLAVCAFISLRSILLFLDKTWNLFSIKEPFLVICFVIFICSIHATGQFCAHKDMSLNGETRIVSNTVEMKGIILREMDKGILFNENRKVVYLPWAKIEKIYFGKPADNLATYIGRSAFPPASPHAVSSAPAGSQ